MTRINAYIASAGLASRRGADELIKRGQVSVNGRPAKLNDIVSDDDVVLVSGKPIKMQVLRYILLNKPAGYITSLSDPEGRRKVTDLIKISERIVPVGRLDYHTRGALLLTNDGPLAQQLMHPKYGVNKIYQATTKSRISDEVIGQLLEGVSLDDGPAKANKVVRIGSSAIEITIHQGRNRQIRRMIEAVDLKLVDLKRVEYGPLRVDDIDEGKWRELKSDEVQALKNSSINGTITSNGNTEKG